MSSGMRLHHHEVDVRDLVIARVHGVERAHAVRNVAVDVQAELMGDASAIGLTQAGSREP